MNVSSLELELTNYACLSKNDTFTLSYNGERYQFDVLECKPEDYVAIVDADVNIDFAEPLDYREFVSGVRRLGVDGSGGKEGHSQARGEGGEEGGGSISGAEILRPRQGLSRQADEGLGETRQRRGRQGRGTGSFPANRHAPRFCSTPSSIESTTRYPSARFIDLYLCLSICGAS